MANKDPSRTEMPTGKRISEARDKGNVLFSADVLSFAVLLGGTCLLFLTLPQLADAFDNSYRLIMGVDCRDNWNTDTIIYGAWTCFQITMFVLIPFCFGLCLISLLTQRVQVGKFFSMKPLQWKFESLNPAHGFQSLIPSSFNLKKFGLTLLKVIVVAFFVYLSIRKDFEQLMQLPLVAFPEAVKWTVRTSYILVFKILIFFAIIAAVDYYIRRKKYYDDLMMTKQEVKDEHKNSEGDPLIKGKIRQRMRQLLRMRMAQMVPKADVVITNPTHVAVALKYDPDTPAPIVVAKGLRKRAELIKKLAAAADVPMVESPPLARSLYRNSSIGRFIKPEFYGAVAAILAKLHKSGRRRFDKKKN